ILTKTGQQNFAGREGFPAKWGRVCGFLGSLFEAKCRRQAVELSAKLTEERSRHNHTAETRRRIHRESVRIRRWIFAE
ncbi:MAG: hypothetical protein LIO51_08650, partial [Clostridiales bacterium]|nr:hypothetical protein [Clostridiales bacterium]